jgi:hypothetical protein
MYTSTARQRVIACTCVAVDAQLSPRTSAPARVRTKRRVRGFDLGVHLHQGLRAAKSGTHFRKIPSSTEKTRWSHLPVPEGISLPPWLDPRNTPRPPDVSAPIPPSTDVYTPIEQACNSMVCANHTFIILREAGQGTFATRAGPSAHGPPYGPIKTTSGPWNEGFTERPSETVHQQRIGTVRRSLAELKAHVRAFNDAVDRARVPYNPYGANSNTYSGQFLRSVGLQASPDRWAPGFSGSLNASLPSIGTPPASWATP